MTFVILGAQTQIWLILFYYLKVVMLCVLRGSTINPLSAIVVMWHPNKVKFKHLALKGLTWNVISWLICNSESVSVTEVSPIGCQMYGLLGTGSTYIQHLPILVSREELALRGLRWKSHDLMVLWLITWVSIPSLPHIYISMYGSWYLHQFWLQ